MLEAKEPSIKEVVTHIMTIIKVYEASCDKVGRIEVYCNGILRDIKEANKKEVKDAKTTRHNEGLHKRSKSQQRKG